MESKERDIQERFAQMGDAAKQTFWGYLGCELDRIDERKAVISLEVHDHHLNLLGILHGGVYASLLDNAMGLIAMAIRPQDRVVTTNLNIHYVAPVRKERITVTAEIVHQSGKLITTEAKVRNSEGNICAFGTGTFRVF